MSIPLSLARTWNGNFFLPRFGGTSYLDTVVTQQSPRLMPASRSKRSVSLPADPLNGRPLFTSSCEGASLNIMNLAPIAPCPGMYFLALICLIQQHDDHVRDLN